MVTILVKFPYQEPTIKKLTVLANQQGVFQISGDNSQEYEQTTTNSKHCNSYSRRSLYTEVFTVNYPKEHHSIGAD